VTDEHPREIGDLHGLDGPRRRIDICIDEGDVRIHVVIRARLSRLIERADVRVGHREGRPDRVSRVVVRAWRPIGRRAYDAQYRTDFAAWKDLRHKVDAELRQQDASWQGYTAALTDAQIQAKIAADPAFVGADQIANEAIHDLLRGPGEPRESNMATTVSRRRSLTDSQPRERNGTPHDPRQ
jgi:hypothetical protein